ncbi:hypothetical protein F4780DRAFT_709704 [Xylariomycetidae sp. FL0641]|nr:hypothetical protein F4780DRAFT_709704 [Xylariomycetidae sp. FL0641]
MRRLKWQSGEFLSELKKKQFFNFMPADPSVAEPRVGPPCNCKEFRMLEIRPLKIKKGEIHLYGVRGEGYTSLSTDSLATPTRTPASLRSTAFLCFRLIPRYCTHPEVTTPPAGPEYKSGRLGRPVPVDQCLASPFGLDPKERHTSFARIVFYTPTYSSIYEPQLVEKPRSLSLRVTLVQACKTMLKAANWLASGSAKHCLLLTYIGT